MLDAGMNYARARPISSRASRSFPPMRRSPRARPAATCSSRSPRRCRSSSPAPPICYGSTLNYIADGGDFDPGSRGGRNLRFGIREHAMCAMLNGFAYDKIFRPSGATFLVFADYCRPSIRLAALSHLPVIYIFTHDSVGVGEDGPTHQPIETVSGLRLIPHLHVIRPADPEETAGAFVAALQRTDGPTLLALSRQVLPNLNQIPVQTRREGVAKGGYIAIPEKGPLKTILLGTGSRAAARRRRRGRARRRRARRLHALHGALQWPERRVPRIRAPRELPPPRRHRGRRAPRSGTATSGSTARSSASTASASPVRAPLVMEKLGINAKSVVEAAQSLA